MPYADRRRQREYQREWMAARRAAWIAVNGPCVQCGSSEDLEVDHVDPTLKVSHAVWSWSDSRRAAELAKCQVLCHKCHATKTTFEQVLRLGRPRLRHGNRKLYDKGCRCEPCRQAKAVAMKAYRERARARVAA